MNMNVSLILFVPGVADKKMFIRSHFITSRPRLLVSPNQRVQLLVSNAFLRVNADSSMDIICNRNEDQSHFSNF